MKDYVIINGVSSKTKTGLAINILPLITKPEMRTLVEEIDGRDGDIITKLGYSAYDKTIEIGLFGNGYDVDDIIAFFNQEGTIIFSNEPTKYYNFTLVDSFDIERLLQFKTSTITFHCQPFKYEVGETPKEIEYDYVSGEGTEITLNNTMNALMELELNPSELTQETTTGKNLFNKSTALVGKNWNGTDMAYSIASDYIPVNENQSYIVSVSNMSNYSSTTNIFFDENNTFIGTNSNNPFTTPAGTKKLKLSIRCESSHAWTQQELDGAKYQLQTGTSASSYEEYTGGVPSPNPEFPSEVQVIKGNNSIKIENKNLFDKNSPNIVNGYLNANGSISSNSSYRVSDYMYIGNFEKITISGNNENGLVYCFYKNDKSLNGANSISGSSKTIQPPANTSYIRVTVKADNLDNYMVESGETASSYIAHQEQVLPLNLPVENLFDKDNANILNNTLLNGTNGSIATFNGCKTLYIPIKSSTTYTISKILSARFVVGTCSNTPTTGVVCDVFNANNTATSQTITSGASDKYLCVFYYLSGTDTLTDTEIINSIQIEKGDKANQYTPFGTTPIEYCKIGNYEDEFEYDGDKWYLNKYIGKVVLDGSETWSISDSGTPNYSYRTGFDGQCIVDNGITNYYVYQNLINNTNTVEGLCILNISSTRFQVRIRYGIENTIENFKNWLSTHNTEVYYVLSTPTITEITDTTLISQLNAIENAVSYDEQTNISQVNTQLPFRIKATAMISGSDSVEITNNGNVYAKPILDIKGTGIINVYLNGTQMFSVDITDEIIVDIPNLETYNPNTSALMNRNVTGNISNFILPVGTNTITVDGAVEKVTITMYQRWL